VPIPFVGKILSKAILSTGYSTQFWFRTESIPVYARNMADIIATIAPIELLSSRCENVPQELKPTLRNLAAILSSSSCCRSRESLSQTLNPIVRVYNRECETDKYDES
jgi:hypothetical protein